MAIPTYFPSPYYYPVTWVPNTYPEHHLPLEDTRHKLAHTAYNVFDWVTGQDETICPRADIRETSGRYYIDVDLPGLSSVTELRVRWSTPRVIVVTAEIKRSLTEEEQSDAAATHKSATAQVNSQDAAKDVKQHTKRPHHIVHFLKKERRIGSYLRAFEFGVNIDHDSLKSKLQNGVLTLIVDKTSDEPMDKADIQVDHHDTSA